MTGPGDLERGFRHLAGRGISGTGRDSNLVSKIFWHDGDGFFFKTMQVSRKEGLHLYKDTLKHNII